MKIGEVAREAGVTIDTIRFYERRGVLAPAERRPSGYREYGEATVERIRLAWARCSRLGCRSTRSSTRSPRTTPGWATCESERWRLDGALERVDARIAELQALRREIVTARAACTKGHCSFQSE